MKHSTLRAAYRRVCAFMAVTLAFLMLSPVGQAALAPAEQVAPEASIQAVQAPEAVQTEPSAVIQTEVARVVNARYEVQPGDNLSMIAAARGTTWQVIYDLNRDQLRNPNDIDPGQSLAMPGPGQPQPEVVPASYVAPAPPSVVEVAITAALSELGTPYRWGGKTPDGFDCSGLVTWAFAQAGVDLPHGSMYIAKAGINVGNDIRRGDLLFRSGEISHIAIYLGDGMMVEAPGSGGEVRVTEIRQYTHGVRVV